MGIFFYIGRASGQVWTVFHIRTTIKDTVHSYIYLHCQFRYNCRLQAQSRYLLVYWHINLFKKNFKVDILYLLKCRLQGAAWPGHLVPAALLLMAVIIVYSWPHSELSAFYDLIVIIPIMKFHAPTKRQQRSI